MNALIVAIKKEEKLNNQNEKMPRKTKPQPLDFEKLADEIIRVEYPTYEQTTIPQMKNAIIRNKHLIEQILKQRLKSAVQGLLEEIRKVAYDREFGKSVSDVVPVVYPVVDLEDVIRLIKKWLPDVLDDESKLNSS